MRRARGAFRRRIRAGACGAFAAALALAAAAPAAAADLEATVTLTPERIGLAETATLEIEARRSGIGRLRFEPAFELENFDLVAGPFELSEMRATNGSFSRALRLSWRLRPRSTGRAAVYSVRLRIGGEVVRLPRREIEVQREPTGLGAQRLDDGRPYDPWRRLFGGRGGDPSDAGRPRVFLAAEVEPERPYAGQQAVYTLYLYTRDDVEAIQLKALPEFRGFWVRDLPLERQLPTEMVEVDGLRYGRVPLVRKALFALRPGEHRLAPAVMELVVRVIESRFFGPPASRPEALTVESPPLALAVQALPPAPPGFGGAVGSLALAARLEPEAVAVGEAATLTLTLSGAGNLQGVAVPELPERRHLEVFPPQQLGSDEVEGTTVVGSRTWSWVLVPERAGRYPLRLPEVPYFDPRSATYRLASAPVVELQARPAVFAAGVGGVGGAAGAGGPVAARLHSIRSAAVPPPAARRLETLLPWLFGVPLAAALLIGVARRRTGDGSAAGPATPARLLGQRLREAASEERPRQAAARIEEAWRDYLAARWSVPPGTPSTTWAERLAAAGAERQAAADLVHLADDLHYLRYAPQLSATASLQREAIERSQRLLRRLR